MIKLFTIRSLVGVTVSLMLAGASFASNRELDGADLKLLFSPDDDGSTVIFQGGVDRVYFTSRLTNAARRQREIGRRFLKDFLYPNTISEGVFLGNISTDTGIQTISGLAGIASDKDTGKGILYLIESFPQDRSAKEFGTNKNRRFLVIFVREVASGLSCRRSNWRKLIGGGNPNFSSGPCEIVIGNAVAPVPN